MLNRKPSEPTPPDQLPPAAVLTCPEPEHLRFIRWSDDVRRSNEQRNWKRRAKNFQTGSTAPDIRQDEEIRISPSELGKLSSHPCDPIFIGPQVIGSGNVSWFCGPTFVESVGQMQSISRNLAQLGAGFLRARAWWPSARPEDFERHLISGLKVLSAAAKDCGLNVVSEVPSLAYLPMMLAHCDVLEVGPAGARNIRLLTELGYVDKTVLLTRDPGMTLQHFYASIEFLRRGGCCKIILAERGSNANASVSGPSLDLSSIITLKRETRFPVFVDCSAVAKNWMYSDSIAVAAIAAGADGILAELQPEERHAQSASPVALEPTQFAEVVRRSQALKHTMNALRHHQHERVFGA